MKQIRLISFDLDGTLLDANSWYALNMAFGVTPEEDKALYEKYLEKKHDYHEWTEALFLLYKERGIATYDTLVSVAKTLPFQKDAERVVAALSKKYTLAIASGAPGPIVQCVAEALGIPLVKAATRLSFGEDGNVLAMQSLGDEDKGKEILFQELAQETDISLEEMAHVGDSINDVKVFEKVGLPIVFGDKQLSDRKDALRIHELAELLSIFPL